MRKQFMAFTAALVTTVTSFGVCAANDDGVVLSATGQASAKATDGSTRKLDRRSPVNAGDTILTGADGKVQFRMKDGTVLALGENSEFAINQYSSKASGDKQDGAALKLVKGTLMQVSGSMDKSAYTLQTPVSTLGIRGTVFNIKVNADGSVTATVNDGAVVSASQQAVNSAQEAVAAAQTTFNAATAKVAAKQTRLKAMKADPDADPAAVAALEAEIANDQKAADTAEQALTQANQSLQEAVTANGGQLNAGEASNTGRDGTSQNTTPVTFTAATAAELAQKVAENNPKDAADIARDLSKAFPGEKQSIIEGAIKGAPGEESAIRTAADAGAAAGQGQGQGQGPGDTKPPGSNDPSQSTPIDQISKDSDSVTGSDTVEKPQSPP